MPELPEVETVCRSLEQLIIGKTITKVSVLYQNIIQGDINEFVSLLEGQTFQKIRRRGKYIIFILDDYIILSHLRMEGKFFLKGDEEINKHEHVIFYFNNNESLRYNDTRKFGRMILFKTNDVNKVLEVEPLSKLGIEPVNNSIININNELTIEYLKEKFKSKKEPIKTALLDQSIICGLGNIYADEVCFMARINPNANPSTLDDDKLKEIITSSNIVLSKEINLGGTTIKSFVSSHKITGLFQNELLVHTKKICPQCHGEIEKIYVRGRGTYYCKNCQK